MVGERDDFRYGGLPEEDIEGRMNVEGVMNLF